MLVIPIVLLSRGKRSPLTRSYWLLIAFYVASKIFEHFDAGFYVGELMSGHSLKHISAACGAGALAAGLARLPR